MATSSTYCDSTDTIHFKCSDSVITCQICMETFESPIILPCQHTFCKKCVVSLVTKLCLDDDGNTRKASFPCPNCRRDCKIRQRGNHSIEEHLKCFPESLLLNTVLESIEEEPKSYPDESVKIQNMKNVQILMTKIYNVMHKRSRDMPSVIILFHSWLAGFLSDVHDSYSNSLKSVSKTTYVYHFRKLIEIPLMSRVMAIHSRPALYHFDIQNNSIEEAALIEQKTLSYINYLGLYDNDEYEIVNKDAQTQTDEEYFNFRLLTELVEKNLLLKDSSLVEWLILIRNTNDMLIDFSLHYTLSLRQII